ncbi:MAG TPA: hypothetical protein V6C52_11420 [Coleofasciculaceae cyanobacterium]|jgi:hypothetical protein
MNAIRFGQKTLFTYETLPRIQVRYVEGEKQVLFTEEQHKRLKHDGLHAFEQAVASEVRRLKNLGKGEKKTPVKIFAVPSVVADEDKIAKKDGKFFIRQALVVSGSKDIKAVEKRLYGEDRRWLWVQFIGSGKAKSGMVEKAVVPPPTHDKAKPIPLVPLKIDRVTKIGINPDTGKVSRINTFA